MRPWYILPKVHSRIEQCTDPLITPCGGVELNLESRRMFWNLLEDCLKETNLAVKPVRGSTMSTGKRPSLAGYRRVPRHREQLDEDFPG